MKLKMSNATVDVIAPKQIIVPVNTTSLQEISGSLWMSGSQLIYYSGTQRIILSGQEVVGE